MFFHLPRRDDSACSRSLCWSAKFAKGMALAKLAGHPLFWDTHQRWSDIKCMQKYVSSFGMFIFVNEFIPVPWLSAQCQTPAFFKRSPLWPGGWFLAIGQRSASEPQLVIAGQKGKSLGVACKIPMLYGVFFVDINPMCPMKHLSTFTSYMSHQC